MKNKNHKNIFDYNNNIKKNRRYQISEHDPWCFHKINDLVIQNVYQDPRYATITEMHNIFCLLFRRIQTVKHYQYQIKTRHHQYLSCVYGHCDKLDALNGHNSVHDQLYSKHPQPLLLQTDFRTHVQIKSGRKSVNN